MAKMSSKEVLMILVVVNILLYYMLYSYAVKPAIETHKENAAQIEEIKEEYEDRVKEVEAEKEYLATIADETTRRETELFANVYPEAENEVIHKFMYNYATKNSLKLSSINLSGESKKKTKGAVNKYEDFFRSTVVTMQVDGAYANIMKFVKEIEELNRSAALTGLNISATESGHTATVTYKMMTVNKGEVKDEIFDYTYNLGLNQSILQIVSGR